MSVEANQSFFTIAFSLFLIMNALGQIPLFISILAPYEHKRQQKIIIRELLIALGILLLFTFFGEEILNLIGISRSVIGITGGALLIIIALDMIFPKKHTSDGLPKHEPLIIPLAVPVITGPGTITAVMLYTVATNQEFFIAGAILAAWIPSLIIILAASYIKKVLGERVLQAVERLGGMIVCLIGIQMFAKGVIDFIKESFML